jgi:hypothetical protein
MKLAWMLVIAALGCGKKSDQPGDKPADKPADKPVDDPGKSPTGGRPAEPFKGPLTAEAILGAKDLVKPFDKWDEGFAKLQAKLGPPTNVKGDNYRWAVQQGDDCTYFYVSKDDAKKLSAGEGFIVGTVMSPLKVPKAGPSGNMDECLAILGKDSGPAEDPSASPPPADGKATVALVVDNAVKARSKWKGAKLTISGNLGSVSTSTSTSDGKATTYTTLTLADTADKAKTIDCSLAAGTTTKLANGKPVKVTATLDIAKWTSGAGDTYKPELKDCAVAP